MNLVKNQNRYMFERLSTPTGKLILIAFAAALVTMFTTNQLVSAQECEIGMFSCDYWDVSGSGEVQSNFFGEAGNVISFDCFGRSPRSNTLRNYSCDVAMIGDRWSRTPDGYYLLEETRIYDFVLSYDVSFATTAGYPGCDEVQEFLSDCERENSFVGEGRITTNITLVRETNIGNSSGMGDPVSLQDAEDLIEQGMYSEAITILNRVIENNSGSAFAYHLRGIARNSLGELEAAGADYEEAVKWDPENGSIWIDWSINNFMLGDFVSAKAEIDRAIELYGTTYSYPFSIRGFIEMALQEYEAAEASFNTVYDIDKFEYDTSNARYWRGVANLAQGDFNSVWYTGDGGVEVVQGAFGGDDTNAFALFWKSIASNWIENIEDGNQFANEALRLANDEDDYTRQQRILGLWYTAFGTDDQALQAREYFAHAIAQKDFFSIRLDMIYLQVMYDLTGESRYQDMLTWYESELEGLLNREVPANTESSSVNEEDGNAESEETIVSELPDIISFEEICTTDDSRVEITVEVSAITIIDSVEATLPISANGDEASVAIAIGLVLDEGLDVGEGAEFVRQWEADAYDGDTFTDIEPISRVLNCGDRVVIVFAAYESDFGSARDLGVEVTEFVLESGETVEFNPDGNELHFTGTQLDTPYDYQIDFTVSFSDVVE